MATDHDGRLMIRATQSPILSGAMQYVYARAERLLTEASGTGAIVTEYVWPEWHHGTGLGRRLSIVLRYAVD
ncbi:MAG: hypothetical protein AB1586_16665 [Pseudomonadota bacterium]